MSIACSNIIIRNLTVKYAGNDGFNIHGDRRGIRLEKVRALSCADEGISAHETTEVQVIDSEIAWNGSVSGGVTDVNDAVSYLPQLHRPRQRGGWVLLHRQIPPRLRLPDLQRGQSLPSE